MMRSQAERWLSSRHPQQDRSVNDMKASEDELASLRQQLDRHNRAYGAGLFTMEQLREYSQPIKDRIAAIDSQKSNSTQIASAAEPAVLPRERDLEIIADEARNTLSNLNFSQKRAILLNTVDKVVGTPSELRVYGSIPLKGHVELQTSHRHRLNVDQHAHSLKIPFQLQIQLPPPRTTRNIVDRDKAGRNC